MIEGTVEEMTRTGEYEVDSALLGRIHRVEAGIIDEAYLSMVESRIFRRIASSFCAPRTGGDAGAVTLGEESCNV